MTMSVTHYSKLEKMYLAAPLNTFYDTLTISISEGRCEIELDIEQKYFHADEAAHGSVFFKLLDDAAYFAIQSEVNDKFILTAKFHVDLKRPLRKGKVKAIGEVIRLTKKEYFAKSTIIDSRGRECATCIGQFFKSKTELLDIEEYEES